MKHLFIDDHDIEQIDNLARKLHQPHHFPNNVVIRPEYRWENQTIQLGSAPIWDPSDQKFKAIYGANAAAPVTEEFRLHATGGPAGGESFACYAESDDGINWEKPFQGLYDYPEPTWTGKPIGKENNILPSIPGGLRGPIYDPVDKNETRRYKGFYYKNRGLHRVVSADGLRWEEMGGEPLSSQDVSQLTRQEDPHLFIAMAKQRGPYGRSFCLTTSEDFVDWTEQEMVFHADQTDQENGFERLRKFFENPAYHKPVYNRPEEWRTDIYNFPAFPYEGLYLALPVMHHWAGKKAPLYENVDSRKSVELASSRDLRHWERVANRAPFMEQSAVGDGSAYDLGQIVTTEGPLHCNNELWFFANGLKYRAMSLADTLDRKFFDTSAVYITKLRLDGFVGLKGGIEWGSVTTKPLEVTSPNLQINVDSWRGKVRTEVLAAEEDRPLTGYSEEDSVAATIDSIDEPVRWKSKDNLGELVGKKVRFRFSIWQGELYAYWLC